MSAEKILAEAAQKYIYDTSFTAPWDTEKWKSLYTRLFNAVEEYQKAVKEAAPTPADQAYEKDALRHSKWCVWSVCNNTGHFGHCPHIAQEHGPDGKCEECKCPQYAGREIRHVEAA